MLEKGKIGEKGKEGSNGRVDLSPYPHGELAASME